MAEESLVNDWRFYVLWGLMTLVTAAIGAYAGAYFRKRGEVAAIRSDFQELTRQLRDNTRLTEQIRTDFAHQDWATREWKTLRRVKAEELLNEVRDAMNTFREQGENHLFHELKLFHTIGKKAHTLALLYFPEALTPVLHFAALLEEGTELSLDIRREMDQEGVPREISKVRTRRLPQLSNHQFRLLQVSNQIEDVIQQAFQGAAVPTVQPHHSASPGGQTIPTPEGGVV
ncbi:hypothetical protein CSC74_03195 [Pseudoxanthomonas yeongjuensis]|nr:hypothetical protein CSC74_03195 [Pseudoxanthomonas yeongjuensis]